MAQISPHRVYPEQSEGLVEITTVKTLMRLKTLSFLSLCLLIITSCSTPVATPPQPTPTHLSIPTEAPACTTLTTAPTPGPDAPSLFPPISESDHVRGPVDATVTIMVYGDYQDGRSGILAEAINRIMSKSPDEVRLVSRVFPLVPANDKALLTAQAAEAADKQGRFWEMYDLLYTGQASWVNLSAADFEQWITAQSSALGMNVSQFRADLNSEGVVSKIQKIVDENQKSGLPGVPIIVINGDLYTGPRNYGSLMDIVQLIALGKRQFTSCPPAIIQMNKNYVATLHTEKGDVVIELFSDKTPITVNSFVFLARNGWYDDITFHRVVPDLFALTGDPSGTGKGTPGYYVKTEILSDLKFDKPGMVAMANSGPDTSNGQFFISLAPIEQFNGKYAIFGQVLSGMDVLKSLTPRDPLPGVEASTADKLLSVTIEER